MGGEVFDVGPFPGGRGSEKEADTGGEVDAAVEEESALVRGGFAP